MLSKLLFECISEEIPPRMQSSVIPKIRTYIIDVFRKNNLKFRFIEIFITSRRVVFFIDDIDISNIYNFSNEIKGPNINEKKTVIEFFLKKNKKNEKDLFVRKVNNKSFFFIKTNNNSFDIYKFFKEFLEKMLKNFFWLKSMRWSNTKERWVRPIKNILCILDNEIVPISFAGLNANNLTYGNRFFSDMKPIIIKRYEDYFLLLKKNNVILSSDKKKQFIINQIDEFIKKEKNNLQLEKNNHLLDELVGFLEWPIVLFGKVNQEISHQLPREIILSVLNKKQKCLALSNEKKISYFITVVNVNNDKVIKGYERILQAQLIDVHFLISKDKRKNLDYFVKKLDTIVLHSYLGSVGEKIKRIISLSKYIAKYIPGASLIKVERAAYLAKIDLATSIINEFPELQGIIGGYYASYFQEDKEVVDAIIEHYKPTGLDQECSKSPVAITLAIADKIDNLVGLIVSGEKISGSYDKFGLRRMSIGVIRTILENNLHVPIKLLINKSLSMYLEFFLKRSIRLSNKNNKLTKKKILELILDFFLEKFKNILSNKGIEQDIVNSILYKKNDINDLLILEKQIFALNSCLNTINGKQILSTYKRVINIVKKKEKNNNINNHIIHDINKDLLIDDKEIILSNTTIDVFKKIKLEIKNNNFNLVFNYLINFIPFINQFMDNIKINCDSSKLRKNRLSLLINVLSVFHLVANFSFIEIKKWLIFQVSK